jgi:hypothetical protein
MDTDLVEASIAAVKQEALKQAGDDHHWTIGQFSLAICSSSGIINARPDALDNLHSACES